MASKKVKAATIAQITAETLDVMENDQYRATKYDVDRLEIAGRERVTAAATTLNEEIEAAAARVEITKAANQQRRAGINPKGTMDVTGAVYGAIRTKYGVSRILYLQAGKMVITDDEGNQYTVEIKKN